MTAAKTSQLAGKCLERARKGGWPGVLLWLGGRARMRVPSTHSKNLPPKERAPRVFCFCFFLSQLPRCGAKGKKGMRLKSSNSKKGSQIPLSQKMSGFRPSSLLIALYESLWYLCSLSHLSCDSRFPVTFSWHPTPSRRQAHTLVLVSLLTGGGDMNQDLEELGVSTVSCL